MSRDGRPSLVRVRWAVRAVLVLGIAASLAGNVLHAADNPISEAIAAWPPLALLLTVELISRVPVHRRSLAAARLVATATIAGIAAWVSYWHMAGVAARYGETGASPYLLPLSVDGLVVVSSVCLVELAGRIRAAEVADEPLVAPPAAPVYDHDVPIGPDRPPVVSDKIPAPMRRTPARDKVIAAHRRTPKASNADLATRLKLSVRTIERHRPREEAATS